MQLILTNSDCDVLDKAASWAVDAGFGGFKNEAQAKTVMLLALSQGEHIGRAIHEYHVINGKLVLKSESMLARFQTAGGSIKYLQYADDAVTVEATHPKGGTLAVTWDLAQAKRAGLLGNQVWAKHPRAMLKARAVTEAIRALYPACLTGALTTEELLEIEPTSHPSGVSTSGELTDLPSPQPTRKALPTPKAPPEVETHEVWSETQQALVELFAGYDHASINAFLVERQQIKPGQTFLDVPHNYAKRILANADTFREAAGIAGSPSIPVSQA